MVMRSDAHQKQAWRNRLGPLMEQRREDLGLLWSDVAEAVGVTTEALRTIRTGSGGMRRLTKRGIERALQWEAGSVDAILSGSDPTPASPPPAGESAHAQPVNAYVGRVPAPWVETALEGAGSTPDDFRPLVDFLRSIGEKSGYSLGETLVEAGLASTVELAVRTSVAPPGGTPQDRHLAQIQRIKDDPNLSRGEKKDAIASLKKLREALGLTQSDDR